ncbi:Translational activator Gcn1 like protein, partial [Aduncisulcus paluster]
PAFVLRAVHKTGPVICAVFLSAPKQLSASTGSGLAHSSSSSYSSSVALSLSLYEQLLNETALTCSMIFRNAGSTTLEEILRSVVEVIRDEDECEGTLFGVRKVVELCPCLSVFIPQLTKHPISNNASRVLAVLFSAAGASLEDEVGNVISTLVNSAHDEIRARVDKRRELEKEEKLKRVQQEQYEKQMNLKAGSGEDESSITSSQSTKFSTLDNIELSELQSLAAVKSACSVAVTVRKKSCFGFHRSLTALLSGIRKAARAIACLLLNEVYACPEATAALDEDEFTDNLLRRCVVFCSGDSCQYVRQACALALKRMCYRTNAPLHGEEEEVQQKKKKSERREHINARICDAVYTSLRDLSGRRRHGSGALTDFAKDGLVDAIVPVVFSILTPQHAYVQLFNDGVRLSAAGLLQTLLDLSDKTELVEFSGGMLIRTILGKIISVLSARYSIPVHVEVSKCVLCVLEIGGSCLSTFVPALQTCLLRTLQSSNDAVLREITSKAIIALSTITTRPESLVFAVFKAVRESKQALQGGTLACLADLIHEVGADLPEKTELVGSAGDIIKGAEAENLAEFISDYTFSKYCADPSSQIRVACARVVSACICTFPADIACEFIDAFTLFDEEDERDSPILFQHRLHTRCSILAGVLRQEEPMEEFLMELLQTEQGEGITFSDIVGFAAEKAVSKDELVRAEAVDCIVSLVMYMCDEEQAKKASPVNVATLCEVISKAILPPCTVDLRNTALISLKRLGVHANEEFLMEYGPMFAIACVKCIQEHGVELKLSAQRCIADLLLLFTGDNPVATHICTRVQELNSDTGRLLSALVKKIRNMIKSGDLE